MTYLIEYTVRGRGDFPVDMLRYDASFPATEWRVLPHTGRIAR